MASGIYGVNMTVNWKKSRPEMISGVSAFSANKALYGAPDGDKNNARIMAAADGFHFEPSDFSDFAFNSISISSPNGQIHTLSFNEDGVFLVDGESVVKDKVTVTSPNGTKYNVIVDDDGNLKTEKEVENDNTDGSVEPSESGIQKPTD